MNEDLLGQFAKLIPLRIGPAECQVPEDCTLLRCFQYLRPYPISMGGFCWNQDCHTCEITVRLDSGAEETVLSCQTPVAPGMTVVRMTDKLRFCLRDLLK
jgi:hypothetical protein